MTPLSNTKILIDGRNIELPYITGIKNYGINLIKTLRKLGASPDILYSKWLNYKDPMLGEILFFDAENQNPRSYKKLFHLLGSLKSLTYRAQEIQLNQVVIDPYRESILHNLPRVFNLPGCYDMANLLYKRLKFVTEFQVRDLDVWHATYPLPMKLKGSQKITTIHDLIPLILPYTTLDNKKFFYDLIRQSIRDSHALVTVSENSKRDIMRLFGAPEEKIHVTYQSLTTVPEESLDLEEVKEHNKLLYNIEYKKYLLYVGTIEPKKNVGRAIAAYRLIPNLDMPLVIVGKRGWLWEGEIGSQLERESLGLDCSGKKVLFLEKVDNEELKYLYAGACCFIFPSLYEGFGLPPLEAMSFGCPVIVSATSCLPEVCGDAALYVDPYSVSDIKNQIKKLLDSSLLQEHLAAAGRKRVQLFSSENYAKRLHAVYQSIS